jgi:bacteriorhodopsin
VSPGQQSSLTFFCPGSGKLALVEFYTENLVLIFLRRVVSYLVSAFTTSNYKWGFYAFGTAAWAILAYNTLVYSSTTTKRIGVSRDHTLLAGWTNFLWLLYPIAFGLTDGGNVIGVTPSAIFFGILDVLQTPVLAFAFLFLARRWDYGRLNLAFTRYGRVHHAGDFPEKSATAPGEPVVANPGEVAP